MANYIIQLKRGKSSSWKALNPVLNPGEPGFEIDTGKVKIGNGINKWVELPYLDPNSVLYTEQTLTDEQKAQARANIGVVEINIVSDDEFLSWINDEKIIEPMVSTSGKIYTNNNNKIYIL